MSRTRRTPKRPKKRIATATASRLPRARRRPRRCPTRLSAGISSAPRLGIVRRDSLARGERVVLTGHYAARPATRGEDSRTTVGSAARPVRGELVSGGVGRAHRVAQVRHPDAGDDGRVAEDGRRRRDVVEESHPGAEQHCGEVELEVVDQSRVEQPLDRVGAVDGVSSRRYRALGSDTRNVMGSEPPVVNSTSPEAKYQSKTCITSSSGPATKPSSDMDMMATTSYMVVVPLHGGC